MNISKQIKELVKHENVTLTELADRLNTSQGNLTNKLSRDKFRLNELQEIANALNYDDIEIILRGNKEDAIIFKDKVEYKPHDVYMMLNTNKDLLQDIEENGIRTKEFRDLAIEFIEEELRPIVGDLWNVKIPNGSDEVFKEIFAKLMAKTVNTYSEVACNDE